MQETENVEVPQDSFEVNSMFDVSFMSRSALWAHGESPDQVKRYVKDPMTYYKELRKISRLMYSANGVYTNVVDYMTALPTLDHVTYAVETGKKPGKRLKKESLRNTEKFLSQIRDKQFIRDVLLSGNVDGEFFAYLRVENPPAFGATLSDQQIDKITEVSELDEDFNSSLMTLPVDFCRIIGRRNSSYVVAFDLAYFDGLSMQDKKPILQSYPKEFLSAYNTYRQKKTQDLRWMVLDVTKTFTFKGRSKIAEPHGRPLGLAAFANMTYQDTVLATKQNTLDEVNGELIIQTFPEGEKKGQSSLTRDQQKSQHEFVKNAVGSKRTQTGTRVISVAAGTKLERLKANTDILNTKDDYTSAVSSDLGFASSLLNGKDGNYSSQQGNSSLVASQVFQMVEQMEYELNKLINENIVKSDKLEVKISYLPVTHLNRKEMVANTKELYTLGRGSLSAWVASVGFNPEVYFAMLDNEIENDFENKYPVHQTAYTMSGGDKSGEADKGGRPTEDDSTNESTLKNKSNGSGQE